MAEVTVRITRQDGGVLELKMPSAEYRRLHERWLDVRFHEGDDAIDVPTESGGVVALLASEISDMEPVG